MMHKKLLVFFILFFFTGCYNYNELNTLAITTAMAIDKKDDKYEVSILIANSKNKESSITEGSSQTVVYEAVGNTIIEALKNIDLKSPRKTYIGHLSSLIISEEVARDGLLDILDLLFRNSESTKRFYMAIATGVKAKDILKIISPLETFPAQTIATNIRTSSTSQAVSVEVVYSNFIEKLMKKGIEPILPTITIEGNIKDGSKNSNLEQSKPKANLKLSSVAAFNNDKLVAIASNEESKGINLILDKIEEMMIYTKCENNHLVTKIYNIKNNITIDIKKEKATINIKANGEIEENNCHLDLTDNKVIKSIEKNTNKEVKNLINKGILFSKKIGLDILGIGNLFYKTNPNFFKKIPNWNNYFKDLKIEVKVKTNINSKGSSRKSLKEAFYGN